MMQIHQLPGDRQQLIFRIRRQIAENTYDTPEKLEIALDRLVDSLGAGDHDDEG
jgi:negative regulator of flagellin synthesis FlgM